MNFKEPLMEVLNERENELFKYEQSKLWNLGETVKREINLF